MIRSQTNASLSGDGYRTGEPLVEYKRNLIEEAFEGGRSPGHLDGLGRVLQSTLSSRDLRAEGVRTGAQRHKDDQAEDALDALLEDAVVVFVGETQDNHHDDVLGNPRSRLERVVFKLYNGDALVVNTGGTNYRGWDAERLERGVVVAASHAVLPRRTPEQERIAQLEAKVKTLQQKAAASNADEGASDSEASAN